MNKKIFLAAILSVLLLTISVLAVNDESGRELSSPAFHETQYTSSAVFINAPGNLLTQFVSVPTGGAELTATFSAATNTGSIQSLSIRVLDNGVLMPPGTVIFDASSEQDGYQAHSFTFGKTLTPGLHTITVQAVGSGSVGWRSLKTEIEELP